MPTHEELTAAVTAVAKEMTIDESRYIPLLYQRLIPPDAVQHLSLALAKVALEAAEIERKKAEKAEPDPVVAPAHDEEPTGVIEPIPDGPPHPELLERKV